MKKLVFGFVLLCTLSAPISQARAGFFATCCVLLGKDACCEMWLAGQLNGYDW